MFNQIRFLLAGLLSADRHGQNFIIGDWNANSVHAHILALGRCRIGHIVDKTVVG